VGFDPEGTLLVAAGSDGWMRVRLDTGQPPTALHGPSNCNNPAYSAQLDALLCERSGRVSAFNAAGAEVDMPNYTPGGLVCGLITSADGTRFAEITSCPEDGTKIREWQLDGGGAVSHLAYGSPTRDQGLYGYGFAGDDSVLHAWI
jgi:hypothetical protein